MLEKFGLSPVQLGPKEGSGADQRYSIYSCLCSKSVQRMHNCLEAADIIGAMSLEALTGTKAPFDERLHELRPFAGNKLVAQRLRLLLHDSAIMQSHIDCGRVQDPYSLRCMPQVHGASRNAWLHLKELTEIELNSVTDNPIIFSSDDTISGGNFHGQPLALPLDYACLLLRKSVIFLTEDVIYCLKEMGASHAVNEKCWTEQRLHDTAIHYCGTW